MLDVLDLLLLKRGTPADDRSLTFRRIDGRSTPPVIYFLPWHTPIGWARQAGFLPLDFLACYEMPLAIVSSEPPLCAQAMRGMVDDAEGLLHERGIPGSDAIVIGLSVGTYPATFLANRIGARLCSVASADRADLAVWHSPATRIVKQRAVQKGLRLEHYAEALDGTHPAQNLTGIAENSVFVVGQRDPFIPSPCHSGLLAAVESCAPSAQVVTLNAGHFRTLRGSARYQRTMLGIEPARTGWSSAVSTALLGSPSAELTAD